MASFLIPRPISLGHSVEPTQTDDVSIAYSISNNPGNKKKDVIMNTSIPIIHESIGSIPACIWGAHSDCVVIAVHGRMSDKTDPVIRIFAETLNDFGWQTLSFDLPNHGERQSCDHHRYDIPLQSSVKDLYGIMHYARDHWNRVALFAVSIGAWLAMTAFPSHPIERAWLLSPVVDLPALLDSMLYTASATVQELRAHALVSTPAGNVRFEDYRYARAHHPCHPYAPTVILHAENDTTSPLASVHRFARQHNCVLDVDATVEHWFHTDYQLAVFRDWLERHVGTSDAAVSARIDYRP